MILHKYLWENSLDTINWFENIENKKNTAFTQFDMIDIYSSISKEQQVHRINIARI